MAQAETDFSEKMEQLLTVLTKYRWWVFGTAFGVALLTVIVVMLLPNKFSSEATLLIVQPEVSTRLVQTAVPANAEDAVQAMKGQVLSRTGLLEVIREFDLYPKQQKSMTPTELADMMAEDIKVVPVDEIPGRTDFTTFKIAYASTSPTVAQAVTEKITELFIDENQKARGREATATSNFLTEELQASQRRLAVQEARMRQFKAQNIGALPEQQVSNMGTLSDLRTQLMNSSAGQSRVQQQRILLEQQRVALEGSITGTLERQRAERASLLTRFTARHPEVIKKDQDIAKTEALLDRVKRHAPATDAGITATPDDLSAAQLDSQVQANEKEGQSLAQEEQRLRGEIAQFQNRLNMAPVQDQQMSSIMSDYELAKKEYSDLKSKQLDAQMGTNVVKREQGQHFQVIDPPTIPPRPSSPRRMRISLGGVAVGLLLGLVAAFLKDKIDASFHSEEALKKSFAVPMVVGIPLLRTPDELAEIEKRNRWEWVAGAAMVLAVIAVEWYVYNNRAGGWL